MSQSTDACDLLERWKAYAEADGFKVEGIWLELARQRECLRQAVQNELDDIEIHNLERQLEESAERLDAIRRTDGWVDTTEDR